ncbi:MAG TPA: DUF4198 domain-containing protein [Thermoanaerobaculia bacterium]
MNRLFLFLCLVASRFLFAHDLWIEPSSFRPAVGDRVSAALRVGQHLQGDPMPRIPSLVERFVLVSANGESELLGRAGADPAGLVLVNAPGPQWLGYQSHAYPVTLEAKKFEDYLKEEGLERIVAARAKKGQSSAVGKERFYRCAKALLNVAGGKGSADTPLRFTLELVPRGNPYALKVGEKLPVTLLYRGKPLANALVVAMNKTEPLKTVRVRTDAKGHATLPLARKGFWLIKAVHMEAAPAGAGVDWESWWASMTFDLQ